MDRREDDRLTCNECGGEVRRVSVACPDNRPGCLVAHTRLACADCGMRLPVVTQPDDGGAR